MLIEQLTSKIFSELCNVKGFSKKKITSRHLGIDSSTSFETEKKVYGRQLLC